MHLAGDRYPRLRCLPVCLCVLFWRGLLGLALRPALLQVTPSNMITSARDLLPNKAMSVRTGRHVSLSWGDDSARGGSLTEEGEVKVSVGNAALSS